MDIRNLTPKERKKIHIWLRTAVQFLFFVLIPSVYTAAFSGVKYIFTQIGAGEKIGVNSFVAVLIVMCVYTMLFGRFFCGFACAFGSLGDWAHAIFQAVCKRWKKRPPKLPGSLSRKLLYLKYGVLTVILLLCFTGVYARIKGVSPWEVFSMLHAGNWKLGGHIPGLILLLLILVGMCLEERFFCKFLCPMGAVFALVPVLPAFTLQRDREQCIKGCRACSANCPAAIELPSDGNPGMRGECFQCQKCTDTCPKKNIHCGAKRIRGNEVWFVLARAVLLFAFLRRLGV